MLSDGAQHLYDDWLGVYNAVSRYERLVFLNGAAAQRKHAAGHQLLFARVYAILDEAGSVLPDSDGIPQRDLRRNG